MKICCGLLMAAALVGGCLLAFYAPHKPVFNICDTSFDWRSIVHSIEALQVGWVGLLENVIFITWCLLWYCSFTC